MRNLLVTGGAGFIGCNFVHYWIKKYPNDRIVVLDKLTYAGNKDNLAEHFDNDNFEFVHGDICDQALVEKLLRDKDLNTVVHFAAESHVDRSIAGPDIFIETNVIGTHSLLKAARQVWLEEGQNKDNHRFHHVSTDEVYGSLGPDDPPFKETNQYQPNSPYSASKAASDHLVRAYHETYGLDTTISNCSNNYGPYQHPEKLIPKAINNLLRGEPVPIYGDGQNIRDWLHVEDHCRAIDLILCQTKVAGVFNIGADCEVTNNDLVFLLARIIHQEVSRDKNLQMAYPNCRASKGDSGDIIQYVDDRQGHDIRYAIDCSKLKNWLKYSPAIRMDSGLTALIQRVGQED